MARPQVLLAACVCAQICAAQQAGWDLNDGQVGTSMCYWQTPRAAIVRDTVYIDGGYLVWNAELSSGAYTPIADGNPEGLVYLFNFSTPFHTSDNQSALFTTLSKAAGGGTASNLGPNYLDGGMLASYSEWVTYGGLLQITDAFSAPDSNAVNLYEAYESGPARQFSSGFLQEKLTGNITRYITYGAAASVPSENLGFYFGGLRAADFGPIYQYPGVENASLNADVNSLTMIQVDMSTEGQEVWSNLTLPKEAPGRASAELVWVPVSEKGILVAIGGVVYPSYANVNSTNNASTNLLSTTQSPAFMSTVSIYDIESGKWYEQETSTPPGTLAQGCAVLASAQDGSSHNIYWYGGFNGIDPTSAFNDDVWILSLPSFMWMKVKSGNSSHARAGHRCVKPYPDQMFVIGGYASAPGDGNPPCLDGGVLQVFNLSSAEWMDSYSPTVWSNYTVPDMIVSMIGGNGAGTATQKAPLATGFANPTLSSIFASSYPTSKITHYYPYNPSPTATRNITATLTPVSKGSGTPSYLAPVLGVVLGLFGLTLLVLGFLLWRRRKYLRAGTATNSDNGTMDNRFWVTNWLRGTPVDHKAATTTTEETPMSPYEDDPRPYMPEVGGNQVHEMMDTSVRAELQATGFVPIVTKGSQRSQRKELSSSPSFTSHNSETSTVSRDSGRPGISPLGSPRVDSPSLGNDGFFSGISNLSDIERGHLRGISETSVSSAEDEVSSADHNPPGVAKEGVKAQDPSSGGKSEKELRPGLVSPITPPPGGYPESAEDVGSRHRAVEQQAAVAPKAGERKSNFAEELDEK